MGGQAKKPSADSLRAAGEPESGAGACLVVGVGNPLLRDDGVGPEVIRALGERELPAYAVLRVREADMFVLLDELRDFRRVIIVDAVDMGEAPGTIRGFTPAEAQRGIRAETLSTHGFGIKELLSFARELQLPAEIFIAGVQAREITFGQGLSPEVRRAVPEAAEYIAQLL